MSARPWLLVGLVALAGCVLNSEKFPRPRDLSQSWLVDRTRILGIRAELAEIRPGSRAGFEALVGHADGEDPELAIVWLACPEGGEFGCTTDLGSVDFETATPEELAAIGFIGFEPGLPPSYLAPPDLLDDLDEAERLEGLNVLVQVTAFPTEVLGEDLEELDFNEVEAAYKRLVVSEATTPNTNPALAAFVVDRLAVQPDAVVHVEAEQRYALGILLRDENGRETYEFLNSDGQVEERVEEPYASWYATGGEVLEPVTLWPYMESTWVAPSEPGTSGTWYVVVRDRRGGMSWWTQPFVVD